MKAAGTGKYPWGDSESPPQGTGNYAGSEVKDSPDWTDKRLTLNDYTDGHVFTSPVGTFKANSYGLYDMGGNVWQMCMDWADSSDQQKGHVCKGGSWHAGGALGWLQNSAKVGSTIRPSTMVGFRVVLVTDKSKANT